MKIHFLGTNGWYDTKMGNTICTLIDSDKYYIILDAGNGIYKIGRFIKNTKPIYLFISHFHLDHIIGLHILNKFNFKQGVHIYGQKGIKSVLSQIINQPFTIPLTHLPFKVFVHELSEGTHLIPFCIECRFLLHASKCLGYRFNLENKIITYCTDTAFCKDAIELAKQADLLIAECSYKDSSKNDKWPHLDPLSSARIAKQANAQKLVLTHFDADIYRTLKERKQAQIKARKIFCQSFIAYDDRVVNL